MSPPEASILCTEDDPDNRDLIVMVLKQSGFEVTCAKDGDDAITLARTESFDLYLLDNWLPDISGTTLSLRLRAFDAATPILFYSGAASEADKDAARNAGAQGYLVKPAGGEALIAEVRRLIAMSRSVRDGRAFSTR